MEIIKKEIIGRVIFKNGLELGVGDVFEDGRIIGFEIMENGVMVLLEWEWEGWGIFINEDGEIEEED